MSHEVKKGPFAALIIESSQNLFFCDIFPETNVVLFTYYQRQFNEQFLRQNFFPKRNALERSYRDRRLKWRKLLMSDMKNLTA